MTNTISQLLDSALEGRRLLDHPFYRRWEAGELREGELQRYAEQYRYFEANLPIFLAELASRMPAGVAQSAVADNLRDEVAQPSHLDLFESFASAFGATNAEISPAMEALVSEYRAVLNEGDVAAIAGLLAYEAQGAAIADSKGDGLRRHYGADAEATKFWDVHGTIEADHATWTMEGLASLNGDAEVISLSARRIADAWWNFLTEREELAAA
jgi:pyrroloquinoline-quinone synthase